MLESPSVLAVWLFGLGPDLLNQKFREKKKKKKMVMEALGNLFLVATLCQMVLVKAELEGGHRELEDLSQ